MALLTLGRSLRSMGWNVVCVTLQDGPIRSDFEKERIAVYDVSDHGGMYRIAKYTGWFFDFIVCNTIAMAFVAGLFRERKKPWIWWIHEAMEISKFLDDEFRYALQECRHVWCVSEYARTFLQEYASGVRILPLGLTDGSEEFLPVEKPVEPFVFLCVAPLTFLKGQDLLVEAFLGLSRDVQRQCELRLVGERTSESEPVWQQIVKVPQIRWKGACSHAQVYQELSQCDVFVLASRGDSFSLVTVEALMLDKPVLISDHAGIAGQLEDGEDALIFPVEDTAELTRRMEWCLYHPEELRALRKRETYLTKFSFEAFRKNVEKLLKEVEV